MVTERIEPTPPHPDAVLAIQIGDEDDPIPYRPGLLDDLIRPVTARLSEPAGGARNGSGTQVSVVRYPGFLGAALARIEALERRVDLLDDDIGAVLEAHGAQLEAVLESIRAKRDAEGAALAGARRATAGQKRMLYALLREYALDQGRDGPIDVEALTVGEASALIRLGVERRPDAGLGFR